MTFSPVHVCPFLICPHFPHIVTFRFFAGAGSETKTVSTMTMAVASTEVEEVHGVTKAGAKETTAVEAGWLISRACFFW